MHGFFRKITKTLAFFKKKCIFYMSFLELYMYTEYAKSRAGMSGEELNSLSPREIWRKFHGNTDIKVKSFFPMIGGGGSVLHSVSTSKSINAKLDQVIASLGK
jgi:hypothetical protein